MADRSVSILCTGDLHLGRHPSRIDAGDDRLSVGYVWQRTVDLAIDGDYDAVALTGDVVDDDSGFHEAVGQLQRGIRALGRAGIPVFAVAGNHDHDVLPEVVDIVGDDGDFRLLGAGGEWTDAVVEIDGRPALRLVGWSFPETHVRRSPMASLKKPEGDLPTVGLLHTELDRPDSDYAPVTTGELESSGIDVWLLGHIHLPERVEGASAAILYPGSLQPLDPGEAGPRGPWSVEIYPDGTASMQHRPIATLCYRRLTVDVDGVDGADELRSTVYDRIGEDIDEIAETTPEVERVVYRLALSGRTALHRRLGTLGDEIADELQWSQDGIEATVDRVGIDTAPPLRLEKLAGQSDPPGVLAQMLLELESGELSADTRELVERLEARVDEVYRSRRYAPLKRDSETDQRLAADELRRRAIVEGFSLLDEMLDQRRENDR